MQKNFNLLLGLIVVCFTACTPARVLTKSKQLLLQDSALAGAHVGISIYDPAKSEYVYNYQGDHYFTPASNTKLFTCYAAMKWLGERLIGTRYYFSGDTLYVLPTGDPSLLSPDFKANPVYDILKNTEKPIVFSDQFWKTKKWGKGWSWDDYMDDYMAERSPMPVYGNVARLELQTYASDTGNPSDQTNNSNQVWTGRAAPNSRLAPGTYTSYIIDSASRKIWFQRKLESDSFIVHLPLKMDTLKTDVPFVTNGLQTMVRWIGKPNWQIHDFSPEILRHPFTPIYSQPTDSLLKPMMHRSDNFYAEQVLLMVSNEKLGYMNERAIIDTLLKTDLKDLPQTPSWVDGSGLSRFNLFTPEDFITLLQKIKNEFGLERTRNILPKGNTGTLTGLYKGIGNDIFAKTGTLTGQVALSGYLICKSKKLLLFSILVNNHNSSAGAVRKAMEQFILKVWQST